MHLATGTYVATSRTAVNLHGSEGAMIVIRSAPGQAAHIRRADAGQNLLDMTLSYTYWYDLEFSGGSAGLRLQGETHHNTFDKIDLHGSQDVLFRANDGGSDVHHNLVINSELHEPTGPGTAEAMYLGCNNGDCVFRENYIVHNHIFGTDGAAIEQGDCVEIKRGSWGNVVADNTIERCNYPGVFVYGAANAPAPNRVLRNTIVTSGDNCIQVTSSAVVQGNIIANCVGAGIAVQPNQGNPEAVTIDHNTILAGGGDAIALRGTDLIAGAVFSVRSVGAKMA